MCGCLRAPSVAAHSQLRALPLPAASWEAHRCVIMAGVARRLTRSAYKRSFLLAAPPLHWCPIFRNVVQPLRAGRLSLERLPRTCRLLKVCWGLWQGACEAGSLGLNATCVFGRYAWRAGWTVAPSHETLHQQRALLPFPGGLWLLSPLRCSVAVSRGRRSLLRYLFLLLLLLPWPAACLPSNRMIRVVGFLAKTLRGFPLPASSSSSFSSHRGHAFAFLALLMACLTPCESHHPQPFDGPTLPLPDCPPSTALHPGAPARNTLSIRPFIPSHRIPTSRPSVPTPPHSLPCSKAACSAP
jgi:hypothetical protein